METQRDSPSLGQWSLLLLLLGLVITPATSRTLSYREAVLHAVDSLNQRSSEENLYRLLQLDSQLQGDENPNIPKPVSFTVKETVCPKTTQQPLEQCDFKDNGLVKHCDGTVILDSDRDYFDISCDEIMGVKGFGRLRGLIRRGRRKIGRGIERIGRRIKDILKNLRPREVS
ncbi:cathelicidin antimicrobial peptide [Mirounga angustirostris]|uniref:cathelicidin antimicrobial peptide n=1 Tax=Mirounga angustirostris TaxID=9716 RepID=UPI001E688CB6|nr:cathelicidin antimicrobial peptide [Mirounga angustirostris]